LHLRPKKRVGKPDKAANATFLGNFVTVASKGVSESTKGNYHTAVRSFHRFNKGNDIALSGITADKVKAYEWWLRKRGVCNNTISCYLRSLRAIYNKGVAKHKVRDAKPFKGVFTGNEPTVKTPQNEWGISEVIGEFATPYNSGDAPRTQNLTRGAELVNGTVVKPGEVFSLQKVLGEVDSEHGFADAGVIQNGEHSDAMGGGLSQVATTVFNAGFEAGMDDTEHHPHQYYFERYPAGREATLWTGTLDMKFTNSTSHAVLAQAWMDGEQIHVRLWSTKYYDVSITSSDRTNFRPVRTERGSGPDCQPSSGGQQGFDITVTRTRKHDGKALPDDVLTTKYDGDVNVICS